MAHLHYDEKYDILYCELSNDGDRYGEAEDGHVTVFRRIDNDDVCGFMIDGLKEVISGKTEAV